MSDNNNYIQSVSYAKLAEYDQTRTDLPIRKYVLIANLLREEQQQQQQQEQDSNMNNGGDEDDEDEDMLLLEQQWFDTCLNELDNDDDETELDKNNENNERNGQYNQKNHHQSDKLITINQKIYNHYIQLHAIYDIHNRRGILLCTSTI